MNLPLKHNFIDKRQTVAPRTDSSMTRRYCGASRRYSSASRT